MCSPSVLIKVFWLASNFPLRQCEVEKMIGLAPKPHCLSFRRPLLIDHRGTSRNVEEVSKDARLVPQNQVEGSIARNRRHCIKVRRDPLWKPRAYKLQNDICEIFAKLLVPKAARTEFEVNASACRLRPRTHRLRSKSRGVFGASRA